MTGDGDRTLALVGVALLVFIGVATGVGVLAAMNAEPGGADDSDAPAVDWTVERVNETHVRIVHGGGDPVDAGEVLVTVGGIERRVTWSGRLAEGDAGIVRARGGQTIRLYWSGGRGDVVLLSSWSA